MLPLPTRRWPEHFRQVLLYHTSNPVVNPQFWLDLGSAFRAIRV